MGEKMRPIVAVTMGDPAGNGPEITVKALSDPALYERCRPIVVGDAKMIEQAKGFVNHPEIEVNPVSDVADAKFRAGTIDVYHLDLIEDVASFKLGEVSAEGGNAAFQSVRRTIELALEGKGDATVTNALNKEAMNLALAPQGMHFDGHTEIYATYTGTKKYSMMLAHHDFRVVHVSTHCSLREACDRVKTPRVLEVIRLAAILASRAPGSPLPASTRMPASTASLAPKKSTRSSPPSSLPARRASTPWAPARRTASSPRCMAAGTTSSSACITTRDTYPPRRSASCLIARRAPGRPSRA